MDILLASDDENLIQQLLDTVDCIIRSRSVGEVMFRMQRLCYSDIFQQHLEQSSKCENAKAVFYQAVREAFSPGYSRSGVWSHSLEKPFGYSGDYEILEHLYDSKIHKKTNPNNIVLDQYVYQLNLINAVRQRKDILVQLLIELRKNGKQTFCSVASGSAREVFETVDLMSGANVTLVDFDPRSLEFAQSRLSGAGVNVNPVIQDGRDLKLTGQYDVLYSFGFFDYLADAFLDSVIQKMRHSLAPGGRIIYSFKNIERYNAWFYDLFCDWRFYPRTASDAEAVAERNGLIIESCIPTDNQTAIVYVCSEAN